MNIIEFIESPEMLNDQSLSPAQRMALKSVYGLPLTGEEFKLFIQTTGLKTYPLGKEWEEASFILGRRSGKSDKIASSIALYEACSREHQLTPGQTGVVMVVASEIRRQAKIVYKYIRDKLRRSPILSKMVRSITRDAIFLTNGIEIQVYPCSIGKVRGVSLVAFIADEVAHWKVEGIDVDQDVLDSARPGLDFPYSKMIKISTSYMMKGAIFQDFKQFYAKPNDDVLVVSGSTKLFRPDYSDRKLEKIKKRNPALYDREYLAHFSADMASMYDPAMIDKAVNKDRPQELTYQKKHDYKCFVDCAGGGGKDSWAYAVGHNEKQRVVVDLVRSHTPKFNPDEVTAQCCKLLKTYKIGRVCGDKFSGDYASSAFEKRDVRYKRSEKTKAELYLEAESAFNTEQVDLPSKEPLVTQLKNLVRKTRSGGKDSVDTDSGAPEDEANVVAGLIELLSGKRSGSRVRIRSLTDDNFYDEEPGRQDGKWQRLF
ncbi:hypothetical protein GH140_02775 [bacterium]|nr:hypothetical protein [bacterium]